MAKTVDLRTYLLLERAFARRLQRSWARISAPTYAAITTACLAHKWDEARRLVSDLDMTEVGTENREWITYMLLSCAVFGAGTVAKGKPSFVGVGTFDAFLKQVTANFLQYLEHAGTTQVQAEALQSIAEDEAKTKALPKVAWEEAQHPRDKDGQFTDKGSGGAAYSRDEGYAVEGGYGPARRDWERLNRQVMDAGDAYLDARTAHRALVERMNAQFRAESPMDYPLPAYKEYRASQAALETANKALAQAEEDLKHQDAPMRIEVVKNLATDVAEKMGIDPSIIHVVHQEGKSFQVGDKQFTEAGHYTPSTREVELNAGAIAYGDAPAVKGIVAHEISHVIYHTLKEAAAAEDQQFLARAINPKTQAHTAWYHERFETDPKNAFAKRIKPQYREEMAQQYPASAVMAHLSEGEMFKGISSQMVKENGHSAYAKSYWSHESLKTKGYAYDTAINETMAEITRYLTHPQSWHEQGTPGNPLGTPSMESPWTKLTIAMHEWYREQEDRKAHAEPRIGTDAWYAWKKKQKAHV